MGILDKAKEVATTATARAAELRDQASDAASSGAGRGRACNGAASEYGISVRGTHARTRARACFGRSKDTGLCLRWRWRGRPSRGRRIGHPDDRGQAHE